MKTESISIPQEEYNNLKEKERNLATLKVALTNMYKDDMCCKICFESIEDPCILPDCLHRFCKRCIEGSIRHCNTNCPLCRERITSRRVLREDVLFHRLLEQLNSMAKLLGIDKEIKKEYETQRKGTYIKKDMNKENVSEEVKKEKKESVKKEKKESKPRLLEIGKSKKPKSCNYIGVSDIGNSYQAKIQVSKKKYHIIGTYELAADAAEIFDRSIKILELDHKTNFRTKLQWKNARKNELIKNLEREIGAENLIGVDLSGISESVDPDFPSEDSLRIKFGLKDDDSDFDGDASVDWIDEENESDESIESNKHVSKRGAAITKKSSSQQKVSSAPDKYVGVSKSGTKFASQIWYNSRSHYLGSFVLSSDAAHVFDRAVHLCGADKVTNFETKKDYENARQKELTVIKRNGTRASNQSRSLPSDEELLEILGLEEEGSSSEEERSTEDSTRRYKGVYKYQTDGRFVCRISYKNKQQQIGPRFYVAADAAFLFDKAASIIDDGRSLNFSSKTEYLNSRREEINEKKLSVQSPMFPSTHEIKKILGIDTKDITNSNCDTPYNGVKRNESTGKFQCRVYVERAGKERVSRDLGVYQLAADAAHVYDRAMAMLSTTVYRKKKSKNALNFKTEKEYTKASKTEVEARGLNQNEVLPADEDIQRMLGIRTIDTYYSTESQSIKIGTKVLKEFGDYGTYEGAVTSLPSSKNNYYFVTYDDGDGEDLYLSELQPLVDAYKQKYKINTSMQRTAYNKYLETDNETKRKSSSILDKDLKDGSRKRSNSTNKTCLEKQERSRKKRKKSITKKKRREKKEQKRKRKEEMKASTKERRKEKPTVENMKDKPTSELTKAVTATFEIIKKKSKSESSEEKTATTENMKEKSTSEPSKGETAIAEDMKKKSTSESSEEKTATNENTKEKSTSEPSKEETAIAESMKKKSTSESSKERISIVENMKKKSTSEPSKETSVDHTTKEKDTYISDSDIEIIQVKKPPKEIPNALHISEGNDSEVEIIDCKTPVKKKRKKSTEPAVVTPSSTNSHRVKELGNRKTTCCVKGCNASKNLQYCSRCHGVLYCSRICQRNDWPRHKAECRKN